MESNLKSGSLTTIFAFLCGWLPNFDKEAQDEITFWFQVLSFTISIIVGLVTLCYYSKKLMKKDVAKN